MLADAPPAQWLGPYPPDIIGAVASSGCILLPPRFWRQKETPGFGGVPVAMEAGRSSPGTGSPSSRTDPADSPASPPPPGTRAAVRGLIPFGILIAVVADP
jgi:lactate permease